jgi:hypothetical protein
MAFFALQPTGAWHDRPADHPVGEPVEVAVRECVRANAREAWRGFRCVGWLPASSGPFPSGQAAKDLVCKAPLGRQVVGGHGPHLALARVAIASTRASIRQAVQKLLKPGIGQVRRFTRRWSCSTWLLASGRAGAS